MPEITPGESALGLPTEAAPQHSSAEMPEVKLGGGLPMDFGSGHAPASVQGAPLGTGQDDASTGDSALQSPTAVAHGDPSNMLRSADPSINTLRGDVPSEVAAAQEFERPADPIGLAQEAPNFGQSAQQFDAQPHPAAAAAMAGGVARGFPTPQPNTYAPGEPNAYVPGAGAPQFGPNPHLAADNRMASLPRDAGYSPGLQPTSMDPPPSALAIDPSATIDAPGDRRLEGAQTPSVIIQKRAPSEVKVGKPASFVIQVQNVGAVEALDVQVHDRIPAGMRLIDASPTPVQQGNILLWQLGAMQAGDERTVTMQLVPEQEGELGSVARVSFEAAASVRTIATRPALKIVQKAPETVLIGQQLEIELEVSNPGSGEATGVVLQEDVPQGLEHPKGRQLDNGLGSLAPGEVRNQVLRLRAVEPGVIQNTIRLTGDDGLTAEHTVAVQVVAPDLKVELSGPARRFLERQTTYQLNIANAGTADATNIEIAVQLDRGFTFVSTDYEGQYDPSRHAVYWSLAQLPAGGSGTVPLTLLPVEEGEQAIVIDARADLGVFAKSERTMSVEGFAKLSFEIKNPSGPIELGAETEYEIRVVNSGSKSDTNVQVQLQLPPGLELVSSDKEAGTDGRGLVAFQPQTELPPGKDLTFSLRLRGVAPGTHLVRAVVASDQSSVPLTKEESTLVYADQ